MKRNKRLLPFVLFFMIFFTSAFDSEATVLSVVKSPQTVKVNGATNNFEVYNISGSNYFKLRDIAEILNGTDSKFNVAYDASKGIIVVAIGQDYTSVGGEMSIGTDKSDTAILSSQQLMINGQISQISAYNIGGNNFFQLRELGEEVGFNVDYDGVSNSVLIDSIVKVPVYAGKIELNDSSVALEVGDTFTLTAVISPNNTSDKSITWSSSKSNIAEVDSNGRITGLAVGTAKVYAKTSNGMSAVCDVMVTAAQARFNLGDKIYITINNDFPRTFHYIYASTKHKYSSVYIESLDSITWNEYYDGSFSIKLKLSGKKTYDADGFNGSTGCSIGYKVYDTERYVVDSGSVYIWNYSVGDQFSSLEFDGYIEIPRAGEYTVELSNYYI